MIPILAAAVLHFRLIAGLPVAQLKTNVGTVNLVLDTGARNSLLPRRLLRKNAMVCFEQLSFCTDQVTPAENFPSVQRMLNSMPIPPQGMLGEDVLSHFKRITFDYEKRTVTLEPR